MKPQFGVCKNKVGCSFAYTGEKIPVPADSKCPECGQPLVVDAPKGGNTKLLITLGILALLVLIGGGAALYAFKDQIFGLAFNRFESNQKPTEEKGVIPAPPDNQETPPANSPNTASTPESSPTGEEKVVAAPTEAPPQSSTPSSEQE